MSNPFDPTYKPQLGKLHSSTASTAEARMKQSLRREQRGGVAFDRNPIRLTESDSDMTKTALIRTPSTFRPKGKA